MVNLLNDATGFEDSTNEEPEQDRELLSEVTTNFRDNLRAHTLVAGSSSEQEARFVWRVDLNDRRSGYVRTISSGEHDWAPFFSGLVGIAKLQRERTQRLADVDLDPLASQILEALDKESSIRWNDLAPRFEASWEDICRAVGRLASANVSEAGPVRLRITDSGINTLYARRESIR